MGQCRTLDADATIGCYYGDYSSCNNTTPTSLFMEQIFSLHTCNHFATCNTTQVSLYSKTGGSTKKEILGRKSVT